MAWLDVYAKIASGKCCPYPETDVKLDDEESILVPKILLRGPETIVEGRNVKNPALVVEVAVGSQAKDRGEKKDAYEKLRILEYIIFICEGEKPKEVLWYVLKDNRYEKHDPIDGVIPSHHYTGLVLDEAAALELDLKTLVTIHGGEAEGPKKSSNYFNLGAKKEPPRS